MELSICIIAKDEERTIGRCLESVKNLGDEIIVVDTGSIDKTKEIAKKYTDNVFDFHWNDDFSEARNFSIEKAQGNWILIIDCDEEILSSEIEKIKNIINLNSDKEGYYFKVKNIVKAREIGEDVVLRLFKRKYKFKGKLHERVLPEIIKNTGEESMGKTNIVINHYGYDKEVKNSKEKNMRNLNLLLSYEEEDKDGYYYYALGNEYSICRNLKKAIAAYEKSMKLSEENDFEVFVPSLILNLMKTLNLNGNFHKSITVLEENKHRFKGFRDMYFIATISAIKILDYKKAEKYLTIYNNTKNDKFIYPSNNFNLRYDIKNLLAMIEVGIKLQ